MFIDIQLAHWLGNAASPNKGDSQGQLQGKALSKTKDLDPSKSSLDSGDGDRACSLAGRGSIGDPAPLRVAGNHRPSQTQSFYLKKCQTRALPSGLGGKRYGIMGVEALAKAMLNLEAWGVPARLGGTDITPGFGFSRLPTD